MDFYNAELSKCMLLGWINHMFTKDIFGIGWEKKQIHEYIEILFSKEIISDSHLYTLFFQIFRFFRKEPECVNALGSELATT